MQDLGAGWHKGQVEEITERRESTQYTSTFRHSCVHVLCKIFRLDAESAARIEFDWMAIGLKFASLGRVRHIAKMQFPRWKLIKASLPDNQRIILRRADVPILVEIYLKDVYEKHYHLKPGDIVFDVGSHIGIFTLKASKLVGTDGIALAFEPEPQNFIFLQRNVALNNATNAQIFNTAVSSGNGILQLCIHPTNTGGHSTQYATGGHAQIPVPSVTLDYLIQEFSIKNVDLLKLDVEGHELEVLRGAGRFLEICRHIAMETHERLGGPTNNQITRILETHGFNTELVSYNEDVDLLYAWK